MVGTSLLRRWLMPETLALDDVLVQLGITEADLGRLVCEGHLRAIRDGGTMRFLAADVAALRATSA
jgi:hypothetical protein